MDEIALTYLTPERFRAQPQAGLRIEQPWPTLAYWLSRPTVGATKLDAGAWCPCVLEGGRVREGRGPVSLLVADVDHAGPGGIAKSASALARYQGAIIPTFSANKDNEKHRIVLVPSRRLTPEEFPIAWHKVARKLGAAGIAVDRGCRNINRLYFGCVTPAPEAWLGAQLLGGVAVNVDALLVVARREDELRRRREDAERRRRAPLARAPREVHRDGYVSAAIANERARIAAAAEGGRHDALLKAAFALARPALGLTTAQIDDALLDTFVGAAGEGRRREGERAIRDAAAAREKAPAR
jgi:hypothetical protein